MSALTQAMLDIFAQPWAARVNDNLTALAAGSSNLTGAAVPLRSQINRFTIVPSTGVAVLPSLLTGEANLGTIVINDGANTLTVYAYADVGGHPEKLNGTAATFGGATGGVTVAAGSAAIFIPEDVPRGRLGGSTANPLNWSGAVFS